MKNFETGPQEPEEEISQREIPQEEVENLQEKIDKKGFVEKHFAEVQTRKAPIRGAENLEKTRGEIFRFERGQIFKAYKILRKQIRDTEERGEDTTSKKELLKEIRSRAKILEKNLDEIERQCYENVKTVEVETKFGEFSVPVVELDLRKKESLATETPKGEEEEIEKDERTPYFFIPGMMSSDFHKSVAVSMAMALNGNKVCVPIEIEQSCVKKPENFREMLKERGDFGIHSEVYKQIIRAMDLKKVNIMGHSLGATIALELGTDPDFKEMEDLIVMEPLGIEEKGLRKLAAQFGINQTLFKFLPLSEQRIKVAKQVGDKSSGDLGLYLEDAKILSKKLYDPEKLSKIKPNGRFQVWFGNDSPIMNVEETKRVFQESEELRQQDPSASQLEIYEVEKGEHMWPVRNALGLSKMVTGEIPEDQITKVKTKDLRNSAMAGILEDIKQ